MTDSDCTRRGEGHVPIRYRVPTIMLNTDREAGCYETSALPDKCRGLVTGQAEPDQCPDCRTKPGAAHHPDCPLAQETAQPFHFVPFHQLEHAPFTAECPGCSPVNVPLPLQTRLLEAFLLDEWPTQVCAFIDAHRDEIVDMAYQRHADGFRSYGSTAYGWGAGERTTNAMEEVADLLVYLSSGEVE